MVRHPRISGIFQSARQIPGGLGPLVLFLAERPLLLLLLPAGLAFLLLHLLQETIGHLEMLLCRLLTFLQDLPQLRPGVVLEDLQAVVHLHVMEDLQAQEGLVKLFSLSLLQCLFRALHVLLAELLLDAHPVALSGLPLASLTDLPVLLRLGPLALVTLLTGLLRLRIRLALLLLLPALLFQPLALLVLLLVLLLNPLSSLFTPERRSGLAAGGLLQSLDELLVVLGDPLRELLDLIVLGVLLGELRQLDLAPVVDGQPLGDVLIGHSLLLSALRLAALLGLLPALLQLLPLLLELALLLLHFLPLLLLRLVLLPEGRLSHAEQGQGRDAQRQHPFGGFQHPDSPSFRFAPVQTHPRDDFTLVIPAVSFRSRLMRIGETARPDEGGSKNGPGGSPHGR